MAFSHASSVITVCVCVLQRLVLDACDLTGGYELEPDSYRALSAVHVSGISQELP